MECIKKIFNIRQTFSASFVCNFIIAYFFSRANARIPAANGADADVPVCLSVQRLCKSVVT